MSNNSFIINWIRGEIAALNARIAIERGVMTTCSLNADYDSTYAFAKMRHDFYKESVALLTVKLNRELGN